MKLGELIAIGRECKGWSQRRLEKESGISNPLISQIETGQIKDPGFTTVVALLDALGIKLDRAATDFRARMGVLREAADRKKRAATSSVSSPQLGPDA